MCLLLMIKIINPRHTMSWRTISTLITLHTVCTSFVVPRISECSECVQAGNKGACTYVIKQQQPSHPTQELISTAMTKYTGCNRCIASRAGYWPGHRRRRRLAKEHSLVPPSVFNLPTTLNVRARTLDVIVSLSVYNIAANPHWDS